MHAEIHIGLCLKVPSTDDRFRPKHENPFISTRVIYGKFVAKLKAVARLEFLNSLTMKIAVFWNVMSCNPV